MVRHRSSFTSVSWIPSEAIPLSLVKVPILMGIGHYDSPPPDRLEDQDLEGMHAAGRFRFANRLSAWIEVEDGAIVDAGQDGGGLLSSTVADFKVASHAFPGVSYPDVQPEPERGDGWVRFVQTTGGRTGSPMPRKISRPPFVRVVSPVVWTTLSLTLHADGRAEHHVVGASSFPRHWFYDGDGTLVSKSGIADFKEWAANTSDLDSPWQDHEHELVVTDAETELERALSKGIMGGRKPEIRRVAQDAELTRQGEPGDELYLVLDGVLSVEVDGEPVSEVGPGAILGERAILEGGLRTSTLRALSPVRVAVATADQIDRERLTQLSEIHRREQPQQSATP